MFNRLMGRASMLFPIYLLLLWLGGSRHSMAQENDHTAVLFEMPVYGSYAHCYGVGNLDLLSKSLQTATSMNLWPLVMLTRDSEDDPHITLHLGWIFKLFAERVFLIVLAIDRGEGNSALELEDFARAMHMMPRMSIFVFNQHSHTYYFPFLTLQTLTTIIKEGRNGNGPSVLVHLNHEQPWKMHNQNANDYIASSLEELKELYGSFDMVFRNYFFEALTPTSASVSSRIHYLPVGPSKYGNLVGNASDGNPIDGKRRVCASLRKDFCSFTGRITYAQSVDHRNYFERELLQEMFRKNHSGIGAYCKLTTISSDDAASSYDHAFQQKYSYHDYIQRAADTAIILCPSGNNPETFRLYEALELGSVPILARPLEADKSFLSHPLWRDYPGPVLDSWYDLVAQLELLRENEGEALDKLQQQIRVWYTGFKNRLRDELLSLLDGARSITAAASSSGSVEQSTVVAADGDLLAAVHASSAGPCDLLGTLCSSVHRQNVQLQRRNKELETAVDRLEERVRHMQIFIHNIRA